MCSSAAKLMRVDRRLGHGEPGDDTMAAGQPEQGLAAVAGKAPVVRPPHLDAGQGAVIVPVREPGAAKGTFPHRVGVSGDSQHTGR